MDAYLIPLPEMKLSTTYIETRCRSLSGFLTVIAKDKVIWIDKRVIITEKERDGIGLRLQSLQNIKYLSLLQGLLQHGQKHDQDRDPKLLL